MNSIGQLCVILLAFPLTACDRMEVQKVQADGVPKTKISVAPAEVQNAITNQTVSFGLQLDKAFKLLLKDDFATARATYSGLLEDGITNSIILNNYAALLVHDNYDDSSINRALNLLSLAGQLAGTNEVSDLQLRINTVMFYYQSRGLKCSAVDANGNLFLEYDPRKDNRNSVRYTLSVLLDSDSPLLDELTPVDLTKGKVQSIMRDVALLTTLSSELPNLPNNTTQKKVMPIRSGIDNNVRKLNLLLSEKERDEKVLNKTSVADALKVLRDSNEASERMLREMNQKSTKEPFHLKNDKPPFVR